ncbi:MAG: radical SAM/SPASM domain-containing protein [Acidobacteriota bacterium]
MDPKAHPRLFNRLHRLDRHARIWWRSLSIPRPPMPTFLILFINSLCNLTCEHCFYWRNLNRRDDLTLEELEGLSKDLGDIDTLNLSGGEPFLRPEFGQICRMFIQNNGVEQIYVPSSGYFTDKTVRQIGEVLQAEPLKLFAVEISLDGMPDYHNRFRGSAQSFQKAMETYDALVELQDADPRLRIHSISTATEENLEEIRDLSTYLLDRCSRMDHHNIALIRGDRKNPSLRGPRLDAYRQLSQEVRKLWSKRERKRFGGSVDPLLQWAKIATARQQRQVIPCRAGVLSAVVYSNGDVGVCENHPPLANLRKKSFREIWYSSEARRLRHSIRHRECYCTNEVFLWPSIVFRPLQLARSLIGARLRL